VLDHPGDPRPTLPTQLTWDEFVAAVHDRNNITFRNVHVIDVPPVVDGGPPPPPSVLPFLLTGDPDQARRFDLRIATRLPADARLHLELPPAAAGVLPPDWRHRAGDARTDGRHRLPLPRTGATIQEIRLPAGVRHSVRLLLEPSADLDAGLHTVTLRQFSDGRQIGSVTWVLRPAARDLRAARGEPA
jgi:hypothetical protein